MVLKFKHAVHISYRMDSIENDMHEIKGSFTVTDKSFPILFGLSEGVKFLKFIVTNLYFTKCNEIRHFTQL